MVCGEGEMDTFRALRVYVRLDSIYSAQGGVCCSDVKVTKTIANWCPLQIDVKKLREEVREEITKLKVCVWRVRVVYRTATLAFNVKECS